MSERIINALISMKQVYLEDVGFNNLNQQRIDEEMEEVNEYKKARLDPERKVISAKIGKKIVSEMKRLENIEIPNTDGFASYLNPPVSEASYYSWRQDIGNDVLAEILNSDGENDRQVKEKNVNNHSGKKPVVTVNPDTKTEFSENYELLESEELNEEFIEEAIDIATNYLCEEGLSEQDVIDLVDELGVEEFSEWILDIGYQEMQEESRQGELLTKDLKARKNPQTSKRPGASSVISHTPSGNKGEKSKPEAKVSQGQLSIDYSRPAKKPLPPDQERIVKRGVLDTAARAALSGWEGHKAARATQKAGGTAGQAIRKGLGAAVSSFFKKGSEHFKEWVDQLLDEGYDLSEYTWDELYEEYENLCEVKGMGGFVDPSTGNFDRSRFSVPQAMYRQPELNARRKSTLVSDNTPLKPEPSLKDKLVSRIKSKTSSSSGMTIPPIKKAFSAANKAITRGEFKRANKIKSIAFNVMEEHELQEKAVSEQQQKLFGLALSVKRGDTPREDASKEVMEIVNTMSEKEIRKYASTSHEGIPQKKEDLSEKIIDFIRKTR